MKKTTQRFSNLLMAAALLAASVSASANVIQYTDRTTFSNLGSISFNYGFDDFDTGITGIMSPGDPWTTNGITYNTSGNNLVVGTTSGLGVTSNVFVSNSGPITGTVNGTYNLFGFDLGSLLGGSVVNIVLNTNAGTYSFLNQSVFSEPGNSFFGFRAGAGENFTSFSVTDLTAGTYSALDGVTLGIAPVPEPGTLALLIPGLLILAFAGRRRSSN